MTEELKRIEGEMLDQEYVVVREKQNSGKSVQTTFSKQEHLDILNRLPLNEEGKKTMTEFYEKLCQEAYEKEQEKKKQEEVKEEVKSPEFQRPRGGRRKNRRQKK